MSFDLTCDAIIVKTSFLNLFDSLNFFITDTSIFFVIVALLYLSISQGCYKIYEAFIRLSGAIRHLDIRFLAVALIYLGTSTFFFIILSIIYLS